MITPRPGSGKSQDVANLWEEKKAAPLWDSETVREKVEDLWGPAQPIPKANERTSSLEGSFLDEAQMEQKLKEQDLSEMVDRVLSRIVPPIVERLVQERLDKLLKEQEQFFELKP